VRQAVLSLPPRYRDALVLFYFHDMDVASAARSLGLPEGTVKARLSRGRAILRGKLPRFLATPACRRASLGVPDACVAACRRRPRHSRYPSARSCSATATGMLTGVAAAISRERRLAISRPSRSCSTSG